MSVNWPAFAEIVNSNQKFLLTSHIRPDCDALGSELGMAGVLEELGKHVRIVNGQATPQNLAFIDPDHKIQALGVDVTADQLRDVDVLMILDTSAWAQLGPMAEVIRSSSARRIVIDHHMGEDEGMDEFELFKNTTAEAAGRLVAEAAETLGVKLTPKIATALFAAIATDTGWFRFGSATGDTYRTAAKLIDAGAEPPKIYGDLYERDTAGRVRLRGLILSRTQTELDGRLAHTYVMADDYAAMGALPTDTEDVINMAMAIEGTQVATILVGQPSGGFKISFRSRCDVDCSKLAASFGGGGHKAAAGAFLDQPFEAAQEEVLTAIRKAMA
jgi:phosphoesterase RecJ-like protein